MASKLKRLAKWAGLLLVVVLVLAGAAFWFSLEPNTTRSSEPRLQSKYLEMRDGVKIAVDIWLPADLEDGAKIPALIRATRYWRANGMRVKNVKYDSNYAEAGMVNGAGYALLLVDARGTGASFGGRAYEMPEDEWKDYGEVVDWIIGQPWSNGNVGAYGVSYDGNTAEMLVANQHAAVKAVAPQFNDWNWAHHLIMPGGVKLNFFLQEWGEGVAALDANDLCGAAGLEGLACWFTKQMVSGVKPVDGADANLLADAVKAHDANMKVNEAVHDWDYQDDPFGPAQISDAYARTTSSGHAAALNETSTAFHVPVGWLDAATVNGALGRYNTLSNPQEVIVGPWSHGGGFHIDPFLPADTPVEPPRPEQRQDMLAFFDRFLKTDEPTSMNSSVTYYTFGAGTWTTTEVWPPDGLLDRTFYFGPDNALTNTLPQQSGEADEYAVDFEATTGAHNRWHTNVGGGDVVYADRASADERLLTYTSDPLSDDMTVTGSPIVTLFASSTHEDGAFFVYLEDVAPDGRVMYITEGQLRATCRAVSVDDPPYQVYGPYRTYKRADAQPLIPGQVVELTFDLWATSVEFKAGHRVRVAIAGADADNFARYPADGMPTVTVQRNAANPSHITIPVEP